MVVTQTVSDNLTDRLRNRLAAALGKEPDQLPGRFRDVLAEARRRATDDVWGELLSRGFTAGQIIEWDRRGEYEEDIGLFWCLMLSGLLGNFPDLFIAKIDRRGELLRCPVTARNELVKGPGWFGRLFSR